jgi:hypothetical protein
VVFTLEAALNTVSALKNWPPESKVLFTLWLTLPQTQGAFRIYSYVLKPLFEKHEEHIDVALSDLSERVRQKANRHVQTIMWQLFLSPNDGLLGSALTSANSVLTAWKGGTGGGGGAAAAAAATGAPGSELDTVASTSRRSSSSSSSSSSRDSLSAQLLSSFSQVLRDGIHADVCFAAHDASPLGIDVDIDTLHLALYRVSLVGAHMCHLQMTRCKDGEFGTDDGTASTHAPSSSSSSSGSGSDSGSGSSRNSSTAVDCDDVLEDVCLNDPSEEDNNTAAPSQRVIAGYRVRSVTTTHDPTVVVLTYACPGDRGNRMYGAVYVRTADADEGDAILAGMTVLVADIKKTATRCVARMAALLSAASRSQQLRRAFTRWSGGGKPVADVF